MAGFKDVLCVIKKFSILRELKCDFYDFTSNYVCLHCYISDAVQWAVHWCNVPGLQVCSTKVSGPGNIWKWGCSWFNVQN